jgi:hypothetical protein
MLQRDAPTHLYNKRRISGSSPSQFMPSPEGVIRGSCVGPYDAKVSYAPTEVLRFRIRGDVYASDRTGFPLEKQLGSVMKELIETSARMREQEERRKKQAAIDRQAEIRRWEAEAQRKRLFEDMENWTKSEQLRSLISKLKSELEKDPASGTEYAESWLVWADKHAALIDPFSGGAQTFLERYTKKPTPWLPLRAGTANGS